MSCPETCDVRLIWLLTFFLCPRNYYNDDNGFNECEQRHSKGDTCLRCTAIVAGENYQEEC